MQTINWENADVLLIHSCKFGKFKGNKFKNRKELPTKCHESLCSFYATWYGTCTKTGDGCTRCSIIHKSNRLIRQGKSTHWKKSTINVGDSMVYINTYGAKTEIIVTFESNEEVRYLELCNGNEIHKSVVRAKFTNLKSKIKLKWGLIK